MENIEKVCAFLDKTKTYYLATAEGDQPRVRPFGTALVYNGRLYIQTGKVSLYPGSLLQIPRQRSVPSTVRQAHGSAYQAGS